MTLECIAPAKLNLVLEIIGRRPDGYHEIVSLMQTIDVADRVRLEDAASLEVELTGEQLAGVPREGPRNLAFRAAHELAEATGRSRRGVRIELEKNIPSGMGLGGGSSDAAAVLRGLDRLWQLGLEPGELTKIGAGVGSDVPFFLAGGTALVTGRGEQVEPLPEAAPRELTLFVAGLEIEDKTRRMYSLISPSDFSDGRRARGAAQGVRRGLPLAEADLFNAFDPHIGELAKPLHAAMLLCRDAGLAVLAAGSGPGFFTPAPLASLPEMLLHALQRDWGVRALACRGLTRAEATDVREVSGG